MAVPAAGCRVGIECYKYVILSGQGKFVTREITHLDEFLLFQLALYVGETCRRVLRGGKW